MNGARSSRTVDAARELLASGFHPHRHQRRCHAAIFTSSRIASRLRRHPDCGPRGERLDGEQQQVDRETDGEGAGRGRINVGRGARRALHGDSSVDIVGQPRTLPVDGGSRMTAGVHRRQGRGETIRERRARPRRPDRAGFERRMSQHAWRFRCSFAGECRRRTRRSASVHRMAQATLGSPAPVRYSARCATSCAARVTARARPDSGTSSGNTSNATSGRIPRASYDTPAGSRVT